MPALSGGMILYRSRSAKSVAWSRLNVIGVSAFFFLPVLVAAFTSADEFHSVMNTGWPAALSHFASSDSWVVFPDPSIPSTTNSFPGYSCGVVRLFGIRLLFLVIGPGYLEVDRGFQLAFERRNVTKGGPELQFGVAASLQAREIILAARQEIDACQRLGVAAVEALGETNHRRQHANRCPCGSTQV